MPDWRTGFDVSNYTWDGNPQTFRTVVQSLMEHDGADFAIVGAQDEEIARQQIEIIQACGINDIDTYAYITFDGDDGARIQRAADLCPSGGRVWLDLEADPGDVDVQKYMAALPRGPERVGVYSRANWLEDHAPNLRWGPDVPYWAADYDGNPDPASAPLPPGVEHCEIKQYLGTTNRYGLGVDYNSWAVAPTSEPAPDAAPPTTATEPVPDAVALATWAASPDSNERDAFIVALSGTVAGARERGLDLRGTIDAARETCDAFDPDRITIGDTPVSEPAPASEPVSGPFTGAPTSTTSPTVPVEPTTDEPTPDAPVEPPTVWEAPTEAAPVSEPATDTPVSSPFTSGDAPTDDTTPAPEPYEIADVLAALRQIIERYDAAHNA